MLSDFLYRDASLDHLFVAKIVSDMEVKMFGSSFSSKVALTDKTNRTIIDFQAEWFICCENIHVRIKVNPC